MKPTIIELEKYEMELVTHAACARQIENTQLHRGAVRAAAVNGRGEYQMHIEGVFGECCVCKMLGVYWSGKGMFRGADIPDGSAARCSQRHRNLVVYEDEPADLWWRFVYWRPSTFVGEVYGPVLGRDVKQARFWRTPTDGRSPVVKAKGFFYPITELELPEPQTDWLPTLEELPQ